MKEKPLFVSFSSQKGGVGKSAMTVLTASCLHYRLGYNVAVLDCDYPQHSLARMRERDIETVLASEKYKRLASDQFTKLNKKAYHIATCMPEEAINEVDKLLRSHPSLYDIIFFDLPGTINSAGILSTLTQMDYIFSPLVADRVVMESSLAFIRVMNEILIKPGKTEIKGLYLFWNLVDGREKTELYAFYEKVIKSVDLNIMQSYMSDSKRFRKELSEKGTRPVFRSTLFPADINIARASRLDSFIDEFIKLVGL